MLGPDQSFCFQGLPNRFSTSATCQEGPSFLSCQPQLASIFRTPSQDFTQKPRREVSNSQANSLWGPIEALASGEHPLGLAAPQWGPLPDAESVW